MRRALWRTLIVLVSICAIVPWIIFGAWHGLGMLFDRASELWGDA